MLTTLWVFLGYWLIVFVACYAATEFAQNYLYDETTPALPMKIAVASMLLAAGLTYTRTRFDTMLTSGLGWSILQAILWAVVFTLVLRFNPLHGFIIGAVAFFLLSGIASLAIDSFAGTNPSGAPASRQPAKPIERRPVGPTAKDLVRPDAEAGDIDAP